MVVFGAGKRVTTGLLQPLRANFSDADILVIRASSRPLDGLRTMDIDSLRPGTLSNAEHIFISVPPNRIVEVFEKLADANPAANVIVDTPVEESSVDCHHFMSDFDIRVLEESAAISTGTLETQIQGQRKCVVVWRCLYMEHGLYFLMVRVFQKESLRFGLYIRGLILIASLPDHSVLLWFMPKSQKGYLRIRARGVYVPNLLVSLPENCGLDNTGSIKAPKQSALEKSIEWLSTGENSFPKLQDFLAVQDFLRKKRMRIFTEKIFPDLNSTGKRQAK